MDRFGQLSRRSLAGHRSVCFSAAGRRLNLSKARGSHQVQALKRALRAPADRSSMLISLTEAGRGYYDRCVRVYDLAEADQAGKRNRDASRRTRRDSNSRLAGSEFVVS